MNNSGNRPRSQRLTDAFLKEAAPTFVAWHSPEPKLLFADGMRCEDPKTGLAAFGPAALDSTPRSTIRVGVIGTGDTIQLLRNWAETARSGIYAGLNAKDNHMTHWSHRGFRDSTFKAHFNATWSSTIDTPSHYPSER